MPNINDLFLFSLTQQLNVGAYDRKMFASFKCAHVTLCLNWQHYQIGVDTEQCL